MDMAWPIGRRSFQSTLLGAARSRTRGVRLVSTAGGFRRRCQQQQQQRHAAVCGQRGVVANHIHISRLQHIPHHHRALSNDAKSSPTKPQPSSDRPSDGQSPFRSATTTPPPSATTPPPIAETLTAPIQTAKAALKPLATLTPHENIYNLPNFLTLTRLLAAPTTAYLLLHDHHKYALALFFYAGVTDLVDGYIARRWKLQTVAGSVLDPGADKALMIIVTVTLAVKGLLPAYLATLILGRDATLALAAIYYRYASLPAPKSFMRYWDFSLPSAEVHPTTVSKYNTFLQLVLIGSALTVPLVTAGGQYAGVLGVTDESLRTAMAAYQVLVAGTTVWSGLSYAFLKDAVTILGKDEALKAKQGRRGRAIIGISFGSVILVAAWFALKKDQVLEEADAGEEKVLD